MAWPRSSRRRPRADEPRRRRSSARGARVARRPWRGHQPYKRGIPHEVPARALEGASRAASVSFDEPDERARDPHSPCTRCRALEELGDLVGLEHGERDLPFDQRRVSVVGQLPVQQGTRPRDDARIGSNQHRDLAMPLVVPRLDRILGSLHVPSMPLRSTRASFAANRARGRVSLILTRNPGSNPLARQPAPERAPSAAPAWPFGVLIPAA